MKRALLMASMFAAACDSAPPPQPAQPQSAVQVRTINSVPPRPARLEPPPVLSDEAPPPKPKPLHQWDIPDPVVFSPEDEKVRAALPFSPAIAMDPIDGDKISIRATTPTYEYKGKIYYFSNEANRRTFMANPDVYLTGKFLKL